MTTSIVTRLGKGNPLSFIEMDTNLVNLRNTADASLNQVGNITELQLAVTEISSTIATINQQITNLPSTLTGKADLTYVDTHLDSMPIAASSGRVNQSFLVFNTATGKYEHTTVAATQGTIISTLELLQTNVQSNTDDISALQINKANIAVTSDLQLNKASITYVDTQDNLRELKNYLASKPVDLTSRVDQTIPVYDLASDKYIHITAASLQGAVADGVATLQGQMSTLLTTTIPSLVTTANLNTTLTSYATQTYTNSQISTAIIPLATTTALTTGLSSKADATSVSSSISTLSTSIGNKADLTYVDTHLAGQIIETALRADQTIPVYNGSTNQYTHTSVSSIVSAATAPTPDRWNYVSPIQNVVAGQSVDIVATIPAKRLYGVSVGVSGLASNQTLSAILFGDVAKTDQQYLANFSYTLMTDTSQAWMYRNNAGALNMYIRLINTSATNISNLTISIVAEPF